jgi:glycosyltransferase involved in cell wall biosynthesis
LFKKESDFCRCFRKELFDTVNIHPVGFLPVLSSKFYDMVGKCTFVISPTAAEGQSGAILQCMATGLIPVVSREAGIDTEDFGFMLENNTLEEIEKMVLQLAQLPGEKIAGLSGRTRMVCEEKYSEAVFKDRWREILAEIQNTYSHQKLCMIPEERA